MQQELFPDPMPEDRCGVCGEGFVSQCILPAGHKEKLHDLRPIVIEEYWEEEDLPTK